MTIASRLTRLERALNREHLGERHPCPHAFHREPPNYREAALPLSPEWDGGIPRCPACGRERSGVRVEAIDVDLRLRPVPLVVQ